MRRIMSLFAAAALVTGCGGGSYGSSTTSPTGSSNNPPAGGSSTSSSITVGNNFFNPSATTVPIGTTVTWTWNSCDAYGTCVSHDVLFDDGTKSGLQSTGTYQRTFSVAGTYPYHCSVHGTSMSGSVTVK